MKCHYCGAEVREEDKFCGECGKPLRCEIAPQWKWGSMIVSLVLIFSIWATCIGTTEYGEDLLIILLIFVFPVTIYLMYKERTAKIKYGLAWILFPILLFFSGLPYGYYDYYYGYYEDLTPIVFFIFIILVIPAIVIDIIYVYKKV